MKNLIVLSCLVVFCLLVPATARSVNNEASASSVLIDVIIRWGTDFDDDGQIERTFPLSLSFSPDGTPTAFLVDVDISDNPINLPAGRIGYGYKFLSPSLLSGPLVASGGSGATNLFRIEPFSENNQIFTDGRFGQFYLRLLGTANPTSDAAQDDGYNTIGNVGITVGAANSLLNNDASVDSVLVADRSTRQGGVVEVNSDGTFTYTPPLGLTGLDGFLYIAQDNQGLASSAYVGIDLSDKRIWFIDNNDQGRNVGSFNNPFQSLGDYEQSQEPKKNDFVYFYASDQQYVSGITLLGGQCLLGQGTDLIDDLGNKGVQIEAYTDLAQNPPAKGNKPTITSPSGVGIELARDNFVRGLGIGLTLDYGIKGIDFGSVDISETTITGGGGTLNLQNGTVNISMDSTESMDAPEDGIRLSGVSGTFSVPWNYL
ncbi:MAG: Ig-like domain-containing protein [bacterium]